MPSTRRRPLIIALAVVAALVVLYLVLPRIAGIDDTWNRIERGDPWWLGIAASFELASFGGYVLLFGTVFNGRSERLRWRESYLITMAGVVATRLLATAGAGGIALTAWALRRSGMRRREVAASLTTFMVILYGVFFATVLLAGIGLRAGVLAGPDPFAVTVLPSLLAGAVIVLALAAALVPADLDARWRDRPGWWPQGLLVRVGTVAGTVAAGVRGALAEIRTGRLGLGGAVIWWAFDIATLWASFHAFGDPPAGGVVVMGYFVGQLANTLPLPGGIGGVEGGMIGAFIAFGVSGGLALVAVLAYRAFAFWLPTVPGAIAYLRLTRIVRGWGDGDDDGDAVAPA